MAKIPFKGLKKSKPGFVNYLLKALIAVSIWFLLFSLVYTNLQISPSLSLRAGTALELLGVALMLAIMLMGMGACLFSIDYETFSDNLKLASIALIFLLTALIFEICLIAPLNMYLMPIAGIGVLLALLLNLKAGFIVLLAVSLIFGLVMQGSADLFLYMFLGGTLALILSRNLRRRNQLLGIGVSVGALNFFTVICLGLYRGEMATLALRDAGWGLGAGIASSFLAMGLLPVFEVIFNITTNITLLELSDLNHPILKRLILTAPGTYHHSLIVGNLAEAACDAIGANSLLARVGAYYHDIGKIEKAEYFSENEIDIKSKHDALTPSMSALLLVNHVKDGVELARRHKLPSDIMDFIEQHHGTGLIYFFYQRALEKAKDESILKEEDFRYHGPRPQTKEAAIVLLADSVEASSRTLSDPTPAKVKSLTQRIINNKFIDGQLDECELSLKDLHRIADSFSKILTGIFHSRVEYPEVSSSSIEGIQ